MSDVAAIANYEKTEIFSPYLNREKACGKCGSCSEHLEAFAENGVIYPIAYEN